jgi:hypothetical protein
MHASVSSTDESKQDEPDSIKIPSIAGVSEELAIR